MLISPVGSLVSEPGGGPPMPDNSLLTTMEDVMFTSMVPRVPVSPALAQLIGVGSAEPQQSSVVNASISMPPTNPKSRRLLATVVSRMLTVALNRRAQVTTRTLLVFQLEQRRA